MTLIELDAARRELVGDTFGSKGEFARLLGLAGHHSLRGYYRRGKIPQWIENRIGMLREIRDIRAADEAKRARTATARAGRRLKKKTAATVIETVEEVAG